MMRRKRKRTVHSAPRDPSPALGPSGDESNHMRRYIHMSTLVEYTHRLVSLARMREKIIYRYASVFVRTVCRRN